MFSAGMQQIVKEMKSHPFTLLAVLGLLCFSVWGYASYAMASDVTASFEQVKIQVQANNTKIDRVLKLQLAEAIRFISSQICTAPNDRVRRDLERTRDQLQEQYTEVSDGQRYVIPPCAA